MIQINRERLLERFLRYVQMDTAADPHSVSYPSTEKQRKLGRVLADELLAMSAHEPYQDENGLVFATIPSTAGHAEIPVVALIAHVDTSPDASSVNITPQVIENYDGRDIPLPAGNAITAEGCPELPTLTGCTLVTTDGSTLLGGDDKAGVAIIMELAETLLENPQVEHGPIRVVMTCDEEIGRGTDKIDLQQLGADVAYTVDGAGAGIIDVETFSADAATVTFKGHNIHPAIAKGRMVNALKAASAFVNALPRDRQTPETTEGREGFIHANELNGRVGEAKIELILRSFDTKELAVFAQQLREISQQIETEFPGITSTVEISKQYRNLKDGLAQLPESISIAEQAFVNLGREYKKEIVRGGTDGSALTEKGLPTPNLSSGQHNIHSVLEFACLDEMVAATEHLVEMLTLWSNQRA